MYVDIHMSHYKNYLVKITTCVVILLLVHWPTFYISLFHVVMMVEGFTPILCPLSALCTTCINFPVLVAYSHMCFVFAHI